MKKPSTLLKESVKYLESSIKEDLRRIQDCKIEIERLEEQINEAEKEVVEYKIAIKLLEKGDQYGNGDV